MCLSENVNQAFYFLSLHFHYLLVLKDQRTLGQDQGAFPDQNRRLHCWFPFSFFSPSHLYFICCLGHHLFYLMGSFTLFPPFLHILRPPPWLFSFSSLLSLWPQFCALLHYDEALTGAICTLGGQIWYSHKNQAPCWGGRSHSQSQ